MSIDANESWNKYRSVLVHYISIYRSKVPKLVASYVVTVFN